ncbi:MAG: proteasome accessory factor [Actinomycetota bacterium]|jgi:predicted DNA-binding transcriptional regulator YafY
MNRLERLINLVAALLAAERPLEREELHERVPGYSDDDATFRRAFERDKDALREMGIPLELSRVDPTSADSPIGYRIPKEEYYLADPELAPDELAALHVAVTTVRLEGSEAAPTLWKLGGTTSAPADTVAALPGSEHLAALFGAVAESRTVTFEYRGDVRTVDPYRLAFRNGFWYLAGYDRDKQGARSFRLDRMATVPVPGPPDAFQRPPARSTRPPRPWEMGDEDEVTARVLVDGDQADRVIAEVGVDAVTERRPDGAVVVDLRVTNRAALRTFVLGLLDRAEVLGPPELRHDIVAWLRALAA